MGKSSGASKESSEIVWFCCCTSLGLHRETGMPSRPIVRIIHRRQRSPVLFGYKSGSEALQKPSRRGKHLNREHDHADQVSGYPIRNGLASHPVKLYFCDAWASIFSMPIAFEPPR
jgi:hypothetical protein